MPLTVEAWQPHGQRKKCPEATDLGGAEDSIASGAIGRWKDNRVAPRPCGNRPEPTPPSVQPLASLPLAESTVVTSCMKHSESEASCL